MDRSARTASMVAPARGSSGARRRSVTACRSAASRIGAAVVGDQRPAGDVHRAGEHLVADGLDGEGELLHVREAVGGGDALHPVGRGPAHERAEGLRPPLGAKLPDPRVGAARDGHGLAREAGDEVEGGRRGGDVDQVAEKALALFELPEQPEGAEGVVRVAEPAVALNHVQLREVVFSQRDASQARTGREAVLNVPRAARTPPGAADRPRKLRFPSGTWFSPRCAPSPGTRGWTWSSRRRWRRCLRSSGA